MTQPARFALTTIGALVVFGGLVVYIAQRTAEGLGKVFPLGVDGCCHGAPGRSRVELAGATIARISQTGEVPRGHTMLLAPRLERRTPEPDSTLVGVMVTDSIAPGVLIVTLVPRDSARAAEATGTLVLGARRCLIDVYRR